MPVTIKSPEEQDKMRNAGRLAADVLDMIGDFVKPGISTSDLDKICHKYITEVQQAIPAPLNYRGFPKSICTSLNHVVCHGIPAERILKNGDSLNIDITVIKDGFHGDTSRMFFVGKPSIKAKRLSDIAYKGMWLGIEQLREGNYLGDIGYAIQSFVEKNRCSVVRDYCGHGIGQTFHKEPNILHYGKKGTGEKIKAGMIFTIEPMVNLGEYETKTLNDGWTAVTKDKSLSAQFEHTIGVTKDGYEIFTQSNKVNSN